MATTIITDFRDLRKAISNLSRIDMSKIGTRALELNNDQIEKKRNRDNSGFVSYTPRYAAIKGSSDVNLVSNQLVGTTGKTLKHQSSAPHMLTDFGIKKTTKTTVEIGFSDSRNKDKAKGIISPKNSNKARPFVGLTEKNQKKLHKYVYLNIITPAVEKV